MGNFKLKDYFKSSGKYLSVKNLTTIGAEIESKNYIIEYIEDKDRFVPPVNFDDPKNFARFGSAEQYYEDAITKIYKTYPYDGSLAEKLDYHNSSSFLDEWIFETKYPRTNGHIKFSANRAHSVGGGWGTQAARLIQFEPV